MKKIVLISLGLFFTTNVFAIEIPIVGLIASQNSPGYICEGNSIGCSSISSIYKVEGRGGELFVCESESLGSCMSLNDIYKITRDRNDTILICPSDNIGDCSTLSVLYKINQYLYDEDITLICEGSSIGKCSTFSALYKMNQYLYDEDITLICEGSSIGKCSTFNALYKFKKDTLTSYNDQFSEYSTCPSNSTQIGDKCYCIDGYAVYDNECISGKEYCLLVYGDNSFAQITNGDVYCDCNEGYVVKDKACITYTESCIQSFGKNIYGIKEGDDIICNCNEGYEWSYNEESCVKAEEEDEKKKRIEELTEQKERLSKMKQSAKMLLEAAENRNDLKSALSLLLENIKNIQERIETKIESI
jgi:hypothetical protein